jgi:membrane-associated phospholipid phosphatase
MCLTPLLPLASGQQTETEAQTTGNQGGDGAGSEPIADVQPQKPAFLRTLLHDELTMWRSPFLRGSYSTHTVKKYVVPFAIISTALIASDTKTADLLPNTRDQATWSGRVSQLGAGYTLAGFSGGMWLFGKATGNHHTAEAGLLALEAVAHSQLITFAIKRATSRVRPDKEQSTGGFWKGGDSFPSGHASGSFAVAAVLAYEYRHHLAVPITAYSLATAISLSRMSARRHWVSDIFVGGSTGFLIGRYIYRKHHDPSLPGSIVNRISRLYPKFGFGEGGAQLAWEF